MNAKTPDVGLLAAFVKEMSERENAGECVRLEMRLSWALTVLAALQLALRRPGVDAVSGAIMRIVAEALEDQIGSTPAVKEVAHRGWIEEYDPGIDPDLPVTNGQPN